MTNHHSSSMSVFPAPTAATLTTLVLAGVVSVVAWEIWARLITPLWIGGPLEPAGLVQASFGLSSRTVAQIIHFLTGLIAFPFGYIFIVQPIASRIVPGLPWPVVAFAYGVALWIFALYIMAHLVAGMPAFLGFGQITWASLVGHVLLGLTLGGTVAWRQTRGL